MATALIIGASRGIGREFVRQLLADNWKVIASARDTASLAELRKAGAQAIELDVALPAAVAALTQQLHAEISDLTVDLIVYVAGVYGPDHGARSVPAVADFDKVLHSNVLGAMQLIPALAPLAEARRGKLVFISSSMGSIDSASSSTGWIYRVSKAALNMAVKAASIDYPKAIFIAMDPGWVRTDMGGANATLSVQQSVSGMLRVIGAVRPEDSGSYRDYSGRLLAW